MGFLELLGCLVKVWQGDWMRGEVQNVVLVIYEL